ncbi:hypothetical protein OAV88_02020 [bacterium]|nr:hypothetical protein [bacterium]
MIANSHFTFALDQLKKDPKAMKSGKIINHRELFLEKRNSNECIFSTCDYDMFKA